MKKPNFAIIIPIYNVEKYLRDCLNSVIHQSYKELQIILIDDGSTDSSPQIAQEFFAQDERITLIRKANGGLSSARNAGLDYLFSPDGEWGFIEVLAHQPPSPPDYIHFLDSDDLFEPHCIERCFQIFSRHSELDIFWHSFWILREKEDIHDYSNRLPFDALYGEKPLETRKAFDVMNPLAHLTFAWSGAFRAALTRDVRFVEGIEYEDASYAFMLFARSSFVLVSQAQLICYRIRPNSICNPTKNQPYPSYMRDLQGLFKNFIEARTYSYFYSDCVNILAVDKDLRSLSSCDPVLLWQLRRLLRWRFLIFLTLNRYKISRRRDPRGALKLYEELKGLGYGSNILIVSIWWLWSLRHFINPLFLAYRARAILRPRTRLRRIMRWIRHGE